jgi:hypothetical protein
MAGRYVLTACLPTGCNHTVPFIVCGTLRDDGYYPPVRRTEGLAIRVALLEAT